MRLMHVERKEGITTSSPSLGGFHGFLASCHRLLHRGGGGLCLQLFDRNLSTPRAWKGYQAEPFLPLENCSAVPNLA